jgi:hypothetical protein
MDIPQELARNAVQAPLRPAEPGTASSHPQVLVCVVQVEKGWFRKHTGAGGATQRSSTCLACTGPWVPSPEPQKEKGNQAGAAAVRHHLGEGGWGYKRQQMLWMGPTHHILVGDAPCEEVDAL